MNKLTAEKCKTLITNMHGEWEESGLSTKEELYLAALEIALPVLEQEGGWISCSERMPEDDTLCLGFDVEGITWTAHYDSGFLTPDCGADDVVFTHWMPLPEPPQPQPSTTPQIDNDGWIDWGGGETPNTHAFLELRFKGGGTGTGFANHFGWGHSGLPRDIIAYRVIENDGIGG